MTSRVVVHAHCSSTKEVEISLNSKVERVIQDGETHEIYVYDDRIVSVKEVVKTE